MIALVLLFSLISQRAYAQNMENAPILELIAHARACVNELNLINIRMDDFTSKDRFLQVLDGSRNLERNEKCLLRCMLEKGNLIVNRDLNMQDVIFQGPQGVRGVVEKCTTIVDNDDCELIYKRTRCIMEGLKTLYAK